MEPLLLTIDQTEEGQVLQVPASLNRYLIPFQKEGIKFLYECLSRKSGAILGDEMGCGKTVQIIGLLCALFNKTGTKKDLQDIPICNGEIVGENIDEWKETLSISPWHPVMIVVPPSILEVWERAFDEFSHFSVSMYSGTIEKRTEAIKSVLYGKSDILLVPKSAFQGEDHYSKLEKVRWKLVIIDEFHNFKNYKAKLSIHLRQLKELHQPLILGMTGTPMQNNYTELWNVVDLAQTNYLGTREDFIRDIDRPLLRGRQKGVNPAAKKKSEAIGVHLREMLSKMMIKRTKQEVFPGDQIPQKTEMVVFCDLSPLQKEVYMQVLELPEFDLVKHGSRPCDCGINQDFFRQFRKLSCKAEQLEYYRRNKSLIKNQSQCCKRLLQARKTAEAQVKGSPAYINYIKTREFAKVSLSSVVSRLPGGGYDRTESIMDDHFSLSGKLRELARLLKKYYTERGKVLLFAHSTQTLDLIQNWLRSQPIFVYLRMDGSTATGLRQGIADDFNRDPENFLFLLSTKAMGQGLTLNSANRVILFDVDWNPSWEIQAQDRAHRIGQTRDVEVVRLISKGTIEEMIYLRQIYKMHLKKDALEDKKNDDSHEAPRVFRGVQGDKHMKGELFGTENLFRFKENGSFLD
ncbi:SNF2_N-domain-containing protein, partial [Fragilariopsis cylindrus CCMP1102]